MTELPHRTERAQISARSLWIAAAGQCALLAENLLPPGKDEVLVRTLYSGISRGTEGLVFAGKVPTSEWERMRGPKMGGSFAFPVKYGYAAVGRVDEGPPELLGRNVFCLHPHQDVLVVPADQVTVLPERLPPARGVLAANMETALNIVWDAGVLPGDRVAVFGAGVVGALAAYIAGGIPGTETVLVDINDKREKLAAGLGLSSAHPGTLEGEFDVLINASASAEALGEAIAHAGQEARIVEASWYGDRDISIALGSAFHARRLSIVCSQVGAVPPSRRARWTFARRLAKALDLLADDRLDSLFSGETGFADLEADYPRILADPETLCHRIRY